MKKTKMLAIVLAVAVMLLGAGYAWWQDAINISGTVDTGKVDVQFINRKNAVKAYPDPYMSAQASIPSGSNNKTLRITIDNLYPGAKAGFDFGIVNNSTMKVKLKDVDVKFVEGPDSNKDLFEKLTAWGQIKYKKGFNETFKLFGSSSTSLKNSLANAIKNAFKDIELEPNECVYFNNLKNSYVLTTSLDADAEEGIALVADIQGDAETLGFGGGGTKPVDHGLFIGLPETVADLMETQCTFDITFTFEQWNAK